MAVHIIDGDIPKHPNYTTGCFGLVNDGLYLGGTHHAAIIHELITYGHYDWESLMNSPQAWGWYEIENWPEDDEERWVADIGFSSDSATITPGLEQKVEAVFKEAFPWIDSVTFSAGYGGVSKSDYGERAINLYDTKPKEASLDPEDLTVLTNGVHVYNLESLIPSNTYSGCFGFLDDTLYLGKSHHARIISRLIEEGAHDWTSLMAAKQKWGWFHASDGSWHFTQSNTPVGTILVRFTTDEAKQTHDSDLSQLVVASIGLFFNKPAVLDERYGEGSSTVSEDEYGNRAREQYLGETPVGKEYCEDCNEYYSEDEEDYHNHRKYCEHCGEYYDPQSYYDVEEHSKEYCPECGEHVYDLEDHNSDYHYRPEPWMPKPKEKIMYNGQEYLVQSLNGQGMLVSGWLPGGAEPSNPTKSWILPWEKYEEYLQQVKNPIQIHPDQTQMPLASVVDLHDARVFAKIAMEYINLKKAGDVYPAINSEWLDPNDSEKKIHIVKKIAPGQFGTLMIEYDISDGLGHISGQGSMSADSFRYYMVEAPDRFKAAPSEDYSWGTGMFDHPSVRRQWGLDEDEPVDNNSSESEVEGMLRKDDPALLAIERNKESTEWRWSYDGTQLHIWRILNRFQYGPSHYDMFGTEGYGKHSQGRVYVSPDGRVGVLYWQITHPEAEQVLDEWVQKQYGKMPDMTYRAYGPYPGYAVSRWDYPIVEVSGLPISSYNRWWEVPGAKPDSWYYDHGELPPSKVKNKTYPAKKEKKYTPGPVDDYGNSVTPTKTRNRKRSRGRNKKYRNRRHR